MKFLQTLFGSLVSFVMCCDRVEESLVKLVSKDRLSVSLFIFCFIVEVTGIAVLSSIAVLLLQGIILHKEFVPLVPFKFAKANHELQL